MTLTLALGVERQGTYHEMKPRSSVGKHTEGVGLSGVVGHDEVLSVSPSVVYLRNKSPSIHTRKGVAFGACFCKLVVHDQDVS